MMNEERKELLKMKVAEELLTYGYDLGEMVAFTKNSVDDFAVTIIEVVNRYS